MEGLVLEIFNYRYTRDLPRIQGQKRINAVTFASGFWQDYLPKVFLTSVFAITSCWQCLLLDHGQDFALPPWVPLEATNQDGNVWSELIALLSIPGAEQPRPAPLTETILSGSQSMSFAKPRSHIDGKCPLSPKFCVLVPLTPAYIKLHQEKERHELQEARTKDSIVNLNHEGINSVNATGSKNPMFDSTEEALAENWLNTAGSTYRETPSLGASSGSIWEGTPSQYGSSQPPTYTSFWSIPPYYFGCSCTVWLGPG
ncbi:hypothetical protein B0H13DRAFT_1869906 [Mycena leptocephala]|nr:hypothetical protein B0H13DRAFT_1869906 [Mycena leptocephala]